MTSIHQSILQRWIGVRTNSKDLKDERLKNFHLKNECREGRIFYSIKICICRINPHVHLSLNNIKKIDSYLEK